MSETGFSEHQENKLSLWGDKKFQDFLVDRGIKPEDKILIERLAESPQKYFLEYHNFFSFEKDNTCAQLKRQLENHKKFGHEPERADFLSVYISFAEKYPWFVCWHLNGFLEKRKISIG